MSRVAYALSVRQPWAGLLVAGRKTVEVRRWATARRGRVLIHAARLADPRPEAWARVSDELRPLTRLAGGIIGEGELTGCLAYRDAAGFEADVRRHLNEPHWFQPPVLYGFTFHGLRPITFRPLPGNVRFFSVPGLEAS
jgi:ASCH domain